MIIDFDTLHNTIGHNPLISHRQQRGDTQFAALMATVCPLFSPWPVADQAIRANPAITGASLSTHPASSNRREGRHARE